MQEQGKYHSSGVKSLVQEHRKLKSIGSSSVQEQGKETSAPDEARSLEKPAKGVRVIFSSDAERNLDGVRYRLGDMVWGKVKSHPWWPGQLYDPALASASAMEFKRDSCFLVAFFGDSTFGWFAESELIPYDPNFPQKSRQTSAHNFVDAVEDSLDEVRRRVKLGLTCHCSSSAEAPESGKKRPGLLYDRQLHDIRRTFEPAKLLFAIKQLACSPFSFSQNMLRNTVAGAQTDSFRRLTLCKKPPEQKKIEGLSESLESYRVKVHRPEAVGSTKVLKNKDLPGRNAIRKHDQKVPVSPKSGQVQKACASKQGLKQKLGGMDELGNVKQHTKGVAIKEGIADTSTSADVCGDEEVARGIVSELSNVQPAEYGVKDKQPLSAFADKEIQASTAPAKERGIRESWQIPEQSESCMPIISSSSKVPGLLGRDSLTTNHSKAQQRKLKKNAVLADTGISKVVPEAEDAELVATIRESNAALKRSKAEEDWFLKLKPTKKFVVAAVELSQARKKVKVVSGGTDKVSAQPKRVVEEEPTDELSREVKKRKLLSESLGKNNSEASLCDHIGNSIASGSLPTLELPQQADKFIIGPTGVECSLRYSQVDCLPVETAGIFLTSEAMVLEAGQLHQKHAPQQSCVDDDATEARDAGAGFVMQPSESDADHKAVDSLQAEIASSISKKLAEKLKDSNFLECSKGSAFQAETVLDLSKNKEKTSQDTAFSKQDHDLKGDQEGESLEASSKELEDQILKDSIASPSKAESSFAHIHHSSAVEEAFACSAVENMQAASQAVSALKCGLGERKKSKNIDLKHLPSSNKVSFSKKRVWQEALKANNKRIKPLSVDKAGKCHAEDGEEHEGLTKKDEEDTHLQKLHEGLMSVAAKPLDAVEEEFPNNVRRAFTNFRKVVYKKALFHASPENLGTASVSEGVIGVDKGNDKMAAFVTEPAEAKAISCDDLTEAEPAKVEVARIQERHDGTVGQKQSEEDSTMSPLRLTKRSVTTSKAPSSSSISLRPVFEANTPVRGSKELLNRFGQRVPRLLDASEKTTSPLSRFNGNLKERALVISFLPEFVLPSEKQLREVFARFGDLNVPLTRVDSKNRCAHIVFRHTQDAEAALISMKENPVFENARFWLKPRDGDRKELAKLSSRNKAFSDRHKALLSSVQLSEAKIDSDTVTNKTASDKELLGCPNNVGSVRVVDRSGVNQNTSSRITGVGREEGALKSNYGVQNAPPALIYASTSQKATDRALGPGKGKLDEVSPGVAALSSVFLEAGSRSVSSPLSMDISEEFLALLHQLHDIVVTTGFVM
ncbi:hypothetical protein L7F22_065713 [Adiantum nelumboides]|nr:hypothetical protein [Adiantum nelumboides]